MFDLDGADDVDLEDDEPASCELFLDPGFGCAVLVAEDFGGFEEGVFFFELFELFFGDEVVVDAFDVCFGFGSCCCGDAEDGAGG